jgi:hypothetical protein
MRKEKEQFGFENLPDCAADYIRLVIKKMRWRKKARKDVQAELIAHFEDVLKDCKTIEEKEGTAKELISNFGDAKVLAVLARRAKKRCQPMWVKILIHSLQILGIIILYIAICAGYIGIGKPNISANYVEWLNDYVRGGRNESLNSAPMIKKAAEISIDEPNWLKESNASWPSDFNEIQLKELENWLAQNTEVLETLRNALKKPYYWNIYDTNESDFIKGGPFGSLMKSLSKQRMLARAMNWQVRYSAYKNNTEDAINDAISLCKFGHRMQGNGLLIEQLVGIAIEAVGYSTIFDILDKTTLSAEHLEKMQQFIQQEQDDTVIDIQAEKACLYDFIQRNFTDDGKGGGRPIRQGIGFAGKNLPDLIFNILTFNLPSKKEIIEKIDNIYDIYQRGFDVADMKNIEEQYNKTTQNESLLLQILTPALGKVATLSWRAKTDGDGLIATLVILRYYKQTGKYPDNLEELLNKGFIKRIPFDAFRNGPLTYRKTDTSFILYSFGEDFDDDGGAPSRWGTGKEGGDQVFWPVVHPAKKCK